MIGLIGKAFEENICSLTLLLEEKRENFCKLVSVTILYSFINCDFDRVAIPARV